MGRPFTAADSDFTARVERLRPRTECGPNFHRGVVEALSAAIRFFGWGQIDAAEHFLLLAELRAGIIDVETFAATDPIGPTWVGITPGLSTWGGDGTSDTTQRDRVRSAFLASGLEWPSGRIEVRRASGSSSDLPIALGILVATGVLGPTTPRPKGTLGLDGRISGTAHELGADTLGELVVQYQGL